LKPVLAVLAVLAIPVAFLLGRATHRWEVAFAAAPGGNLVAFVQNSCADAPCETLWIGPSRDEAVEIASLAPGTERCTEIAWTKDGSRAAFLIDGYQLRLYDAKTHLPAGQIDLISPDGRPSSRIARGVTFSDNGKAVTFDECPRAHSGCRAGLVAVPIQLDPEPRREGS
jgi:hypothetical protein